MGNFRRARIRRDNIGFVFQHYALFKHMTVADNIAFGLKVLCGAYALGHVSGGHFNPAVSVGLATAGRFDWKELPAYVVAQCVGSIAAVATLWAIKSGAPGGFKIAQGAFASNAYGQKGGRIFYDLPAAFIAEAVLLSQMGGVLGVLLGVGFAGGPAVTGGRGTRGAGGTAGTDGRGRSDADEGCAAGDIPRPGGGGLDCATIGPISFTSRICSSLAASSASRAPKCRARDFAVDSPT